LEFEWWNLLLPKIFVIQSTNLEWFQRASAKTAGIFV